LSLYFQGRAFAQITTPWQRVEGLADINPSFTNTQSSSLPVIFYMLLSSGCSLCSLLQLLYRLHGCFGDTYGEISKINIFSVANSGADILTRDYNRSLRTSIQPCQFLNSNCHRLQDKLASPDYYNGLQQILADIGILPSGLAVYTV
jgi:hypothetical protein